MSPERTGRAPSVLVAMDGPQGAHHVLRVARELARLEGATPRLLVLSGHVLDPRGAAELLELPPEELHGVALESTGGDPRAAVLREAAAEGTRLVVMSPALCGAPPSGEPGDVAEAVLAGAACPVVLVPPGSGDGAWRLREVLLPHDGTPTSARGVVHACALARKAGAWLRVLHVATSSGAPLEPGSLIAPRYVDQPQHEWPSWAAEFLERLGGMCRLDVDRLRLVLGHGEPGAEVVRIASESPPDLILLAWLGSTEPGHGRTVQTVLAKARCPVLVVRAHAPVADADP